MDINKLKEKVVTITVRINCLKAMITKMEIKRTGYQSKYNMLKKAKENKRRG